MEEIIKTEMLTKIYNPLSQNPKLALDQISLSIKDAVERSNEYLQYNDNDGDVTLGDLFSGLFN